MDKNIQRGLNDRLYEKRKAAALELEKLIKDLIKAGDSNKINEIISKLSRDFAYAVHQPNSRNGGLIGLAATAIALGQHEVPKYLEKIIHPVLACFGDQDARVRYYACESLYNISKVAKGEILLYFNEIFDNLCKLTADSEVSVKKGADLLDRLIKDIVAEKATTYVSVLNVKKPEDYKELKSTVEKPNGKTIQVNEPQSPLAFSLPKFIILLKERIYVMNPYVRMFLVSWIRLLDSISDLDLIYYLPTFLSGLIQFLSDGHDDVKVATHSLLDLLLQEIENINEIKKILQESKKENTTNKLTLDNESGSSVKVDHPIQRIVEGNYIHGQDINLDFPEIIHILISHLDSSKEEIQIVVLSWLATLLKISPLSFIPLIPDILSILLSIVAHEGTSRESAIQLNLELMKLIEGHEIEGDDKSLNISQIVKVLTLNSLNDKEQTRLAALDWLIMLNDKCFEEVLSNNNETISVHLLRAMSDPSEKVIDKVLQLLANIANRGNDKYFESFMIDLLQLFKSDRLLLESRGNFILRTLCISLNPEMIYSSLAKVLENEPDLGFISIMVQMLNNNLITAPELTKLRHNLNLKSNMNESEEDWNLFKRLFKSWSHNPPALLSLCMLCQSYQLAFGILETFTENELTVSLMVQIDILVQLLESPVFAKLRMQLLSPESNPYLYRCLYGILMLLPQSTAFHTLKTRLDSVSNINNLPIPSNRRNSEAKIESRIEEKLELLEIFKSIQQKHEEYRLSELNKKAPRDYDLGQLSKLSLNPASPKTEEFSDKSGIGSNKSDKTSKKQSTLVRKISSRPFGIGFNNNDKD
ncbi:PtdIns(3,5)P(2) sythesis regulation factor [Komagataella phaffii CBS 7435]|uniref:Protein involved in regulated synthesis of PtdIns(3,5)P(2) n=2 Tax=Komagataella phaffii TaxID=460519 RepID=C4QYN7_KOMPG|nr:Protein involved in regulated synthesis of PtdIns(3,5)P(2) [Komagataella phaffii GS115]AOA60614.1 GQ67_01643T0 [Komagataella phaffii]CAH2447186.1 PtdIns(3,5)P(2) sythesis regulation factor [Komagataella phaffii CBS 7435]AOA66006.1 GQ68_01659T0 [Komagataella phaffii GS115]CAY68361.1 Protein involved in regulated synthesis of PtdIns(3,5)P(2) [Komagataella phaffii GS115]CCA37428.1 PtdIns(3,5)P(2) sythesis regulation factor [Komagataella phaffii CBS 7435]